MLDFFKGISEYRAYIVRSAKASLKAEVSSSYLSWLWWILDPLLFMLVYSFMAIIVFGKGEPYFPVFVFIGLNMWKFFQSTINSSTKMIRSNKSVISRVYMPKYVLIISEMLTNFFKMIIAFTLVVATMILYRVPLSWKYFNMIPVFILLILFTFGVALWLLDIAVYIADTAKLVKVLLRLMFYLSGIFYSIPKRIDEKYLPIVLNANPMAFMINSGRCSLLYDTMMDYRVYFIWFFISLILIYTGLRRIRKNENSYIKVI